MQRWPSGAGSSGPRAVPTAPGNVVQLKLGLAEQPAAKRVQGGLP